MRNLQHDEKGPVLITTSLSAGVRTDWSSLFIGLEDFHLEVVMHHDLARSIYEREHQRGDAHKYRLNMWGRMNQDTGKSDMHVGMKRKGQ